MIVLDIPTPPSVNALFYNRKGSGVKRRGRGITTEYRSWRAIAGWAIQIGQPGRIKGPVSIAILLSDKTRGDPDNRVKATLDLLVTHGVIEADSKRIVRAVSIGYASDVHGAQVVVTPCPA